MATALATAFVRIRPDTARFGPEMEAGINRGSRGVTGQGKKQGRLFGSTFAKAAGVFSAVGILKFGKDSVAAFKDAQAAQTRLSDAYARFPKITDVTRESFDKLNLELQKKTRFDDEAFASGEAILAQFGLTGKQIQATAPILADYAAKTGKDVPAAAKLLGKASLGNARALKDLGINFKATGDQSADMATVIGLVQKRVGGFAEKEGKTAAGQAAILGNQFNELQETVGARLVPALNALIKVALVVLRFFTKYQDILVPLAAAIGAVIVATKTWAVVQRILNLVLAANPIGLIITAVIALGVALVVAYKKSDTFRKIVNTAFRVVWGIIQAVFNWIKRNWPLLIGILTGPIGVATVLIIKNWKKIKDGLTALVTAIRTFFTQLPGKITHWIGAVGTLLYDKGKALITGFWNGIKAVWKSTIEWFKNLPSKILSALGIHSPPDWAINAGRHIMGGILKGLIPGGKDLLNFAKDTVGKFTATLFAEPTTGATRTFARGTVALGQQLAAQLHGWTGAQWRALYDLWNNESGWNPLAKNPTSSAFGIPQFLSSTAAQYGVLGNTNPAAQIAAGMKYIQDVYGNPLNAWSAWLSRSPHWYDKGGWLMPGATLAVNKTGRPERVLGPRESYGNTYNINIAVPPSANQHEIGRQVVETIKAYERGSGTKWRKS